MLNRVNARFIPFIVLSLSLTLLVACSTNKVNKPTKLERVKNKVDMTRLWKKSVGTGDDELSLQLSPVLIDNNIYSIDINGYLYVVDRFKGKKVWKKDLDEGVSGGLGFDSNHLFYTTFQGELVCIDSQNGNEIWRVPLTSEAIAAPASNGELVVVQSIDGKLSAFNTSDGVKRWRYDSIGPLLSLRGAPTPLISKKYTISNFANGEMLAFDNESGTPIWRAAIGTPKGRTELDRLVDADGKPVLDGDKLYAVAYQGKLVSLDVRTGQEIWSKELSSFNSIALGFSLIYLTTPDGIVLALNQSNGTEVWRNEKLKYRRLSAPVVIGQSLVTVDLEGYLHVLSLKDGEILARKRPDGRGVMGEMLVDNDRIYMYGRSGNISAYRLNSSDADKIEKKKSKTRHASVINRARSIGSKHK